jgi:farnesyl-diphosphate farnesyltransferase
MEATMPNQTPKQGVLEDADLDRLQHLLKMSSKTYALCIPLLPRPLQEAVIISYLLLRNADTLEDDTSLSVGKRIRLLTEYTRAVKLLDSAEGISAVEHLLTDYGELDFEEPPLTELFYQSAFIARQLQKLPLEVVRLVVKDIGRTGQAMTYWLKREKKQGRLQIVRLKELEDYCYAAAGILGELLTGLFCRYSPQIDQERQMYLRTLEIGFANGLQIANIIKDSAEDRRNGKSFIPVDFLNLDSGGAAFLKASIFGMSYRYLGWGVEYAMAIPPQEAGIRQFCLLPIMLAAGALNRILADYQVSDFPQNAGAGQIGVADLMALIESAVADNRRINLLWQQCSSNFRLYSQRFNDSALCTM